MLILESVDLKLAEVHTATHSIPDADETCGKMDENAAQDGVPQKQRGQVSATPCRRFSWHLTSAHLSKSHDTIPMTEYAVTTLIQQTLDTDTGVTKMRWLSDTEIIKRKPSLPAATPVVHLPSSIASTFLIALTPGPESFFDVFGVLGIPMIAAFFMSSAALVNQAYIQMYPAKYVNMVMNTAKLDDGDFWMMPQPEPMPKVVSAVILLFFAGCYLGLVLYTVCFRHRALMHEPAPPLQTVIPLKNLESEEISLNATSKHPASVSVCGQLTAIQRCIVDSYITQFSSLDGIYNKYYVSRQ